MSSAETPNDPASVGMTGGVAVIGAGPAGLMAADVLSRHGVDVTLFDRMASPGRKLLLAGRGGLNLTHGEDLARFLTRYGSAVAALTPSLERFGPDALRDWCRDLGIATFVGTSGRVFPECFKTSPLLRAWLRRLDGAGVRFRMRHHWTGWTEAGHLRFSTPEGDAVFAPDATILALGGASWPQLGSDGAWVETLRAAGIEVAPLRPANCGFLVDWSEVFRGRFEGTPLKNVALSFEGTVARGDMMVTRTGLEGGPLYALAAMLRDAIAARGGATLGVALRPDLPAATLAAMLGRRRPKETLTNALRRLLHLAPAAIGLLQEGARTQGLALGGLDATALAAFVNAVPLRLTAPMPLARAISTAGGVRLAGLDPALMARDALFIAGEMLDWEAPTGGYLLQACFATGATAADGVLAYLGRAQRNRDRAIPIEWEAPSPTSALPERTAT